MFIVSYTFFDDGEMFPMMKVLVLPIRESCKIRVNLDSLKDDLNFVSPLDKDFITLPRVVRERLMFLSSER